MLSRALHCTHSRALYLTRSTLTDKKRKEIAEREADRARREANQLNEERQWAEFTELRTRMTLMEQQLWTLRKAQAQGTAQMGGSGWRSWLR